MQVDLEITSASVVTEFGKKFVLYEFDIYDGKKHHKGHKRYSELLSLHSFLVKHSGETIPKFPPKILFKNFTEATIEKRRCLLSLYFKVVIKMKGSQKYAMEYILSKRDNELYWNVKKEASEINLLQRLSTPVTPIVNQQIDSESPKTEILEEKPKKVDIEYGNDDEDEYSPQENVISKLNSDGNFKKTKTIDKDLNAVFEDSMTQDDEDFFHEEEINAYALEFDGKKFLDNTEVFIKNQNGYYLNVRSESYSTKLGKHSEGIFYISEKHDGIYLEKKSAILMIKIVENFLVLQLPNDKFVTISNDGEIDEKDSFDSIDARFSLEEVSISSENKLINNSEIYLKNKNEQKFILIKPSGEWGLSKFPHSYGCFKVQVNHDYVNLTNPLNFTLTLSGRTNDLLIDYVEKNEIIIYEEISNNFLSIEDKDVISISNDDSSPSIIFQILDNNKIKNQYYFRNGVIVYLNCDGYAGSYLSVNTKSEIDVCSAMKASKFIINQNEDDLFTFRDLTGEFLDSHLTVQSQMFKVELYTNFADDQIEIYQQLEDKKLILSVKDGKEVLFLEQEELDKSEKLCSKFNVLMTPKI
eukprot:gene9080-1175_t